MKSVYLDPTNDLQKEFSALTPGTTVYLAAGRYFQKAEITVPNVTVIGCGEDTVLCYDDCATKPDENGLEMTTFKSYTLAVTADNVTLKNLRIENIMGDPATNGQEVALSVVADRFLMENCTLYSTQDTLFLGPLPDDLVVRYDGFLKNSLRYREGACYQKFINCKIYGTVDFIFGCGNALFEGCKIISIYDNRPIGYVSAPAHHLACDIGFVFFKCDFVSENAPVVYLARPWRDFGKSTFIDCTYESHIPEIGFINWNDTYREKTARFSEYSTQNFNRAKWSKKLSKADAEKFIESIKSVFDF